MKLMFASDIHGSKYYCEKLLVKYMEESPEKLILLGDLLYHGPRNDLPEEYDPKRVCTLLNLVKDNLICVKGNCDAEVDQMILDFPIMSEYAVIFADDIVMYLTHGHTYNIENPLPISEHNVMIYGHTHIPLYEENDNGIFVNPGSVSIPKEGSEHSYLIYEDGVFTWKDLDGNEYMTRKIY
jgi:putative phosphoesterase